MILKTFYDSETDWVLTQLTGCDSNVLVTVIREPNWAKMHLKTSLRHFLLKRPQKLSQRISFSTQHERVYESTYEPLSIPRQNTADYCMSRFDKYAPYPALECSLTGKRLTYADVQSMTQRFGSQLLSSGLQPGDRIAALVPNCPEFGPLLLGALSVGVTLVPISPVLGPKEVSSLLNISRPKMVVTNDALLPGLTEAIGLTQSREQVGQQIRPSDKTHFSDTSDYCNR